MNKTILALGADIKNRILLAKKNNLYFGPEIADLSQAENFSRFKREVRKITAGATPKLIACDLHPSYFSSSFAREYSLGLKSAQLKPVQHHYAHIASVIQEHNLKKPIIGVCFDGTGFGEDGNFWGGEFILADKSGFRRLGHLKYRLLPGGDKVVSQPWRMAVSILGQKAFPFLTGVKKQEREIVLAMLVKEINSVNTSSAGRLFDAASALLGLCKYASYEAEGPMKLEALCTASSQQRYGFRIINSNGCLVVDTDPLFLQLLEDLGKGLKKHLIATKFHNSMAAIIVKMVTRLGKLLNIPDIVLSGGVFQNSFLKTKVMLKLSDLDFNLFTNVKSPVNDLNISLGQYYVLSSTSKN